MLEKVVGISIYVHANGVADISACVIKAGKKGVDIVDKITGIQNIKALTNSIPKGLPVSLNLSGKGVLIKRTDREEYITPQVFAELLPNADIQTFFVQHFKSGTQSFIAAIRKDDASKWIKELKSIEFVPLMLSLSAFPVENIISQLNIYGPELCFGGHVIKRDEQLHWLSCRATSEDGSSYPLKIENQMVNDMQIMPYAAAFQLALYDRVDSVIVNDDSFVRTFSGAIAIKNLRKGGLIMLLSFFMLLLINFCAFLSLTGENQALSASAATSAGLDAALKQLTVSLNIDEAFLNAIGWDNGICKTCLINHIAANQPSTINWVNVNINPIVTHDDKTPAFQDGQIRIAGTTEKLIELNEWIARIRTLPVVRKADLEDYYYDQEINAGKFSLLITFHAGKTER